MKKTYIKPVFIAEAYNFNESFAKCSYTDTTTPLRLIPGNVYCEGGDNGHVFDDTTIAYKRAVELNYPQTTWTLFNDGSESNACLFDWDGRENITTDPTGKEIGSFSQVFDKNGGNSSSGTEGHRPGYNGGFFFS